MPNKTFAQRLAEDISPDDALLADITYDAYVEGGAARKDLFDSRQPHGAFGPGQIAALLPSALLALQAVSAVIIPLITADNVGKLLDCIKQWIQSGGKKSPSSEDAAAKSESKDSAELTQSQLRTVLQTMEKQLVGQGLDQDKAEVVSLRTLKALLEEPTEGLQIANQLAAAPASEQAAKSA